MKPSVISEKNKILWLKSDFFKAKQLIYGRTEIKTQDGWFLQYNMSFLPKTSDLYSLSKFFYVYVHLIIYVYMYFLKII